MISTVFIGCCEEQSERNALFVKKYEKLDPCVLFFDEEEALSYLEKNRTMLVVIDSYMGKTDVTAFIKKAKGRGVESDYIVFTADNNRETITELYYSGVFRVIVKPFDYELFCSVADDYERFLFSGRQYVAEKKRLPITSALDAELLDIIAKEELTEKELSQKLGKPVVIIKQSLNRLIYGMMIESETYIDGEDAITKYRKIN